MTDRRDRAMLMLVIAAYVAIHLGTVHFTRSDENVYYYMGKLVAAGRLPYRDFRFAHPPLRLLPPTLVFACLGFNWFALKAIPVLACATTGYLVAVLGRLLGLSATAATLACGLFLFSTTCLSCGSFYLGPESTLPLVLGGLVALRCDRPHLAGALLGLSALVGLYGLCAAAGVALHLAWTRRRPSVRLLCGFLIAFGLLNAALSAWIGPSYWRQVFLFQWTKVPDVAAGKSQVLGDMMGLDVALLALTAVGALIPRVRTRLPLSVAVCFSAGICVATSPHLYYFLLCVPFLAIQSAAAVEAVTTAMRARSPGRAIVLAFMAFAVFGLWRSRPHTRRDDLPEARELADLVTNFAEPGDTVFGDSDFAPLLALLSGRAVLADHVDTDPQAYLTGTDDLHGVRDRLSRPWPGVIAIRDFQVGPDAYLLFGPMADPEFGDFVRAHFTAVRVLRSTADERERFILLVQNERSAPK